MSQSSGPRGGKDPLEQIAIATSDEKARLAELVAVLQEKVDQLDKRLARIELAVSGTVDSGPAPASGANPRATAARKPSPRKAS